MSTVKSKKLQVGTDATASNNFTIYQPDTPDGTLKIGVGNADSPTEVAGFNATGLTGDGSQLTNLPAGGKILQVVNKLISTQGSQTIGTTDTQIGTGTDFDISITPQGTASKFVVSARWFGEGANIWDIVFNIQRDGVRINTDGATASNRLGLSMATQTYGSAANSSSTPEILTLQTVDSTGSTIGTAITYTLVAASSANRTVWTNRCFTAGNETGISELMIMEVAQ